MEREPREITAHIIPKTLLLRRTLSQPGGSSGKFVAGSSVESSNVVSSVSKFMSGGSSDAGSGLISTVVSPSASGGSAVSTSDAVESLLLLAGQNPGRSGDKQIAGAGKHPPASLADLTAAQSPIALLPLRKSASVNSGSRSSAEHSVNYYQRMRMRNNEASKRCRLKRRIKQESLDKTRIMLERHGNILKQRLNRLEKIKILLTEAYHQAAKSSGHCSCVSYCKKIWDTKDENPDKNDVSNAQLLKESKYLRTTNLEEMIGAEINNESRKPLRRGPRKAQEFDPSILDSLSSPPGDRTSMRTLSDTQSSGSQSGGEEGGSIHLMSLDPEDMETDHPATGNGNESDEIEVLGVTDRSNMGALDLSNPKKDMSKVLSVAPPGSMDTKRNITMLPKKEETPVKQELTRRVSVPISLGPREPLVGPRDLVVGPREPLTSPRDVKPSLVSQPLLKLQPREANGVGANPSKVEELLSPTTIIVTPLTSSFSPTLLTIPINRSMSLSSVPESNCSLAASVVPPSPSSTVSPALPPPTLLPQGPVRPTTLPPALLPATSSLPPALLPTTPLPLAARSSSIILSPLEKPTVIKEEPETIIKTEEDVDMAESISASQETTSSTLFSQRSLLNSSQDTLAVSSQGSSSQDLGSMADNSTQDLVMQEDEEEDFEPQLKINTDEVDGPGSPENSKPDLPKCVASAHGSCSGSLIALNQLNQTLDLKTMEPRPPGVHTTAEKYIIMSRLQLVYWEADEKPSWICSKHRTMIVHNVDMRQCCLCNRNVGKKGNGPLYIISYRIALEYYMTQGKFLDIGRGVCQTCRLKSLKGLDFSETLVTLSDELGEESAGTNLLSSSREESTPSTPSEEKIIQLPVNPRPSIKLKSLAAIQPVISSSRIVQPIRNEISAPAPSIRSEISTPVQPIRSEALNSPKISQSIRKESLSLPLQNNRPDKRDNRGLVQPIRPGASMPTVISGSAAASSCDRGDMNSYGSVRSKINDLNSALQQLNPRYRPLGFSITKLSDLGQSTLQETLMATEAALETVLTALAPGEEKELLEAVLPGLTSKLTSATQQNKLHTFNNK